MNVLLITNFFEKHNNALFLLSKKFCMKLSNFIYTQFFPLFVSIFHVLFHYFILDTFCVCKNLPKVTQKGLQSKILANRYLKWSLIGIYLVIHLNRNQSIQFRQKFVFNGISEWMARQKETKGELQNIERQK